MKVKSRESVKTLPPLTLKCLQTCWLRPFSKILHPSIMYSNGGRAPCSLCRARHPGVSGLKLPLSPPWALCMRGRKGLIRVQKYVKGPVQSSYHIYRSNFWMWYCSSFCHLDLDTVPPYKQILHIHSIHNKYSHQKLINSKHFLTKMISFLLTTLGLEHIQRMAPICIQCGVEQIPVGRVRNWSSCGLHNSTSWQVRDLTDRELVCRRIVRLPS